MLVAELAAHQYGVVHLEQLRVCGLTDAAISRRVRARRLHRIHHQVYAVGHSALSLDGRELAAVLSCGPGAILSHRSAARHWEILRSGFGRIEVTAARSREPKPDFLVHTSRVIAPEDRTEIDGIPVTSLARTIIDLAEVESDRRLASAIHQAEVRGLFDLAAVEAAQARVPGRRGRHRLHRVLAIYQPADHELDSRNELRFPRALPGLRPARAAAGADRAVSRRLLLG